MERLDFDNHKAFVRRVKPDYYTTAMTHTKVNVLYEDRNTRVRGGGAGASEGPASGARHRSASSGRSSAS